jgi:hypothetical protein
MRDEYQDLRWAYIVSVRRNCGEDGGSLSSHSHFVVDEYVTVPSCNGC